MTGQSFERDNRDFEAWLGHQSDVVKEDLDYKHERMRETPFIFLRATFFRWAKTIERSCKDLAATPAVLSVGDTHTENFGTWRDAEGRLVWGVNDFDEASVIPYAFDLVRLATSVVLAPHLALDHVAVADAIATGYRNGLEQPRPTLVDEDATWMQRFVACTVRNRKNFLDEIEGYPDAAPPDKVVAGLKHSLPQDATIDRFAARRKGSGGLGRPRFVAIASWRGDTIVREAKALVPSAWDWAHDRDAGTSSFLDLARGAFRAPDPVLAIHHRFVIRRIAPDSRKVDFGKNPGTDLNLRLLASMGFDLGSIHAASRSKSESVLADLKARPEAWLHDAARVAAAVVTDDYDHWAGRFQANGRP